MAVLYEEGEAAEGACSLCELSRLLVVICLLVSSLAAYGLLLCCILFYIHVVIGSNVLTFCLVVAATFSYTAQFPLLILDPRIVLLAPLHLQFQRLLDAVAAISSHPVALNCGDINIRLSSASAQTKKRN